MLSEIGVDSIADLFKSIPDDLHLNRPLDLPAAKSEPELIQYFQQLAKQNLTIRLYFLVVVFILTLFRQLLTT